MEMFVRQNVQMDSGEMPPRDNAVNASNIVYNVQVIWPPTAVLAKLLIV